tara:strand:- start:34394 stop:34891 length:498 start_codon:yes stop_codon:yes gene_type:complete
MSSKEKNFWDDFRFEFNLCINKNIICQRLFDVKRYNKDVLKSIELKELMENITSMNTNDIGALGIIPNYFKDLCQNVAWTHYNPYREYVKPANTRDIFENEDVFTFQIKVDKKVVASSQFSGNWFQKDVRHAVNIRDIIPKIIREIETYMSLRDYTMVSEEKITS